MSETTPTYKTDTFSYDGEWMVPGEAWSQVVNQARHDGRTRGDTDVRIERLGIALSGAVAGSPGEVSVDIAEFLFAARPPLEGDQARSFQRGYDLGNVMLGNTVGPHMQTVGVPHE